jgi:hypothetical protein
MLLLSKLPDWPSHLLLAADLVFFISYSFEVELSGRPGYPVYLKSQWQVYDLTQELAEHMPAKTTAINSKRLNLMKMVFNKA